jgi:hypothetical protein
MGRNPSQPKGVPRAPPKLGPRPVLEMLALRVERRRLPRVLTGTPHPEACDASGRAPPKWAEASATSWLVLLSVRRGSIQMRFDSTRDLAPNLKRGRGGRRRGVQDVYGAGRLAEHKIVDQSAIGAEGLCANAGGRGY